MSKEKTWKSGIYKPRNPEKYIGIDVNNIIYRSSWELSTFEFLDYKNKNILKWASESIAISYKKPMLGPNGPYFKNATYFPDLYVEYINKNGEIKKELIEIKPKKQTKPSRSKNEKTKLLENYTHAVNEYKWLYARKWCEKYGIEFKIFTEDSIFR